MANNALLNKKSPGQSANKIFAAAHAAVLPSQSHHRPTTTTPVRTRKTPRLLTIKACPSVLILMKPQLLCQDHDGDSRVVLNERKTIHDCWRQPPSSADMAPFVCSWKHQTNAQSPTIVATPSFSQPHRWPSPQVLIANATLAPVSNATLATVTGAAATLGGTNLQVVVSSRPRSQPPLDQKSPPVNGL